MDTPEQRRVLLAHAVHTPILTILNVFHVLVQGEHQPPQLRESQQHQHPRPHALFRQRISGHRPARSQTQLQGGSRSRTLLMLSTMINILYMGQLSTRPATMAPWVSASSQTGPI